MGYIVNDAAGEKGIFQMRFYMGRFLLMVSLLSCLCFAGPVSAKNLYLISKITTNGEETGSFKYTKKGLVKTIKETDRTYTYSYTSKGRVRKSTRTTPWDDGKKKSVYTYQYKGGKAVKAEGSDETIQYIYSGKKCVKAIRKYIFESTDTWHYSKKGNITRMNLSGPSFRYTYDKNGFFLTSRYDSADAGSHSYSYKNTYKGGRLTKQVITGYFHDEKKKEAKKVVRYKYIKVNVPKKYLTLVKKQQKRLLLGIGPDLATFY